MNKKQFDKKLADNISTRGLTFKTKSDFPPGTPNLLVVLRGLLLLAFDGNRQCEIGAVKLSEDNMQLMPHNFEIRLWQHADQCAANPFPELRPTPTSRFDITVIPPALHDGIYVFNPNDGDLRDYKFVLDFEGDDFYGPDLPGSTTLGKNSAVMTPRVVINNGLVYTHRVTDTRFQLEPEPEGSTPTNIGPVADIVAIGVYLRSGGRIQLRQDGVPIIDPETHAEIVIGEADHYQIDVLNRCNTNDARCRHMPLSRFKEKRNDFFLYYTAFNLPVGPSEIMLKAKRPLGLTTEVTGICHLTDDDTSDPAPCGPSGFGKSRNLDS